MDTNAKRILIGLVGLATLLPQILGCMIGEPCELRETSVYLVTASPLVGVGSMTVELEAQGYGATNTCGDDGESNIAEYRWDLDGDGVFELRGLDSEVSVTFAEPGDHLVQVEVVDDLGATARDSLTFEVAAVADPVLALERARVFVSSTGWTGTPCPAERNVCVTVSSDVPVDFDAELFIAFDDGRLVRESFGDQQAGLEGDAELCFSASLSGGHIDVLLTASSTVETRDLDLPAADVSDDCTP